MIKLSSFYPFAGFMRVTQEFYEEKALVKTKSLTYENIFEFEYKDVDEISNVSYVDNSQNSFAFWLLVIISITLALLVGVFCNFIAANTILLRIEQFLYVCGLILYITSFKKNRLVHISDRNDNILTYIKVTRQNHDLVRQAIGLMKTKSENAQEFTTTKPFPEGSFVFEHTYYDFSKPEKTTDRFYEGKIIGFQKGIYAESVYSIQYNRLSGKVYRGKSGVDVWGTVLTLVTLLISVIAGFMFGFGSSLGISISMNTVNILFALGCLFLLSLPIKLIKREVIGLYDKSGNIKYWAYANGNNRTKMEKIIGFIQSKISNAEQN
ncbi:MAG: hypothetical protein QM730_31065 [Anaerolineales bacterium]